MNYGRIIEINVARGILWVESSGMTASIVPFLMPAEGFKPAPKFEVGDRVTYGIQQRAINLMLDVDAEPIVVDSDGGRL